MAFVNIRNQDLILSTPVTLLTANTVASATTLTVKNIQGFSTNQILLIGIIGNQGAEIVKTHASTPPSGTTITLAAATQFPHSSSTAVTVMLYDQVEISTATTATGSKSVLGTLNIFADSYSTNFNDTANSTGFYFARFKNSITSTFSVYSSPIPTTGYSQFSARSIIDNALDMINRTIGQTFTDDYAFKQLDNCQMECIRELKRWSFMQKFNFSLGEVTTGQWKVALPVDCDDQNSNRSIYNFKIGTGTNMNWVDKEKWNEIIQSVAHTTLANNISIGDATITLTDSSDFTQTGTVAIGANNYTYTANNQSTGVLTLSVISTTTNTAGQDAFFGASQGMPYVWTTYGGYIYFYPTLDSNMNQQNAYLDYYSSLILTTTDTQTIVLPDPTVVQYYLAWKFLLKQANGQTNDEIDAMRQLYLERRAKMIQKETANRTFQLKPQNRQSSYNDDDAATRLGNFNTGF